MSSSDSEEEGNEDIPEVEECQRLCEEFAEITGTDTACAQFYLQDRKWNLEHSVNDFFEDNKEAIPVNNRDKESQIVVVVDRGLNGLTAATAVIAESALSSTSRQPTSKESSGGDGKMLGDDSVLKFITWNIDGLNEKNLLLRTKAVYKYIIGEQADIVFLQEVVPESASYLIKHLKDYECIFGNEFGYFVGTFLKKSSIDYKSHEIIEFDESRMMRNALKIEACWNKLPFCLINSHLESTAEGSNERKHQLSMVFKESLDIPSNETVILAGDLNLRDKELNEIGGLPTGLEDVWISCGKRKECAYTFDMTRNDNLMFNGRFKPRCRFDRVYMRQSSPSKVKPKFFGLIGLERLLPHKCFPSDHWGILCHFDKD